MLKVGIDAMNFYTPHYYFDLNQLAVLRNQPNQRYRERLGQDKMAVIAPDEDVVTMGADAAYRLLKKVDVKDIELLLFATESAIDQSKAAGIYVHRLLGLSSRCRVLELKQACYSATGGLQMALSFLREFPDKKVLLIASDVAKYGLGTVGESSQGAAAVAFILSANPRLMEIEPESGFYTEDVMDFWRPNYRDEAIVEGKYSCELYLKVLQKTWEQYKTLSKRNFLDHARFCYHVPVPRLVETAHQYFLKINGIKEFTAADCEEQLGAQLLYGRIIGNCYTAALYLSLLSLLENTEQDLSGKRIGFYSYGSGCTGEFFSGVISPHYKDGLEVSYHQKMIDERQALSVEEYEHFYKFRYPEDGSKLLVSDYKRGYYRLMGMEGHKRLYKSIEDA